MTEAKRPHLNVRALDHVTLVVRDLERSRAFYRDLLGMSETPRPKFDFPGLWFQAGGVLIHMNVEGPEAGRAGMPPFEGNRPSRGLHFAFRVDDCDEAAQKLQELGIPVVSGPRSRPDGARQLYIHDPDNYLIELFSA